jgi:DNA-binding HxlR family transcriptional regulator
MDRPHQERDYDRSTCPVERTVTMLSGKWRLMVLFRLSAGPVRFNGLARSLTPISPRILAATLRDLEAEGLLWRRSQASVPPHVTYGLTAQGQALSPVFDALALWWLDHKANQAQVRLNDSAPWPSAPAPRP